MYDYLNTLYNSEPLFTAPLASLLALHPCAVSGAIFRLAAHSLSPIHPVSARARERVRLVVYSVCREFAIGASLLRRVRGWTRILCAAVGCGCASERRLDQRQGGKGGRPLEGTRTDQCSSPSSLVVVRRLFDRAAAAAAQPQTVLTPHPTATRAARILDRSTALPLSSLHVHP